MSEAGRVAAGRAAGAYATVSPRVSAGLVGVAIATALVPPVAASGLCLARGEFMLAWGAFELFLTNFAAIQFTTSVMMWLFGLALARFHSRKPDPGVIGRATGGDELKLVCAARLDLSRHRALICAL
jgi:uncharacterized membrane protein